MATLLEPSPDPLPPAPGLSAPPPVSISSCALTKDPTITTTSSRSRAVTVPFHLTTTIAQSQAAPNISSNDVQTLKKTVKATNQRMPPTAGRPLVPHSERRPVGRKPSITRAYRDAVATDSDHSKSHSRFDITPDGGSAGREGRQFAVANVGNNGRIYLRPTVRPANQRCPQPQFVFPVTPPSTAGLDSLTNILPAEDESSDLHISQWTPTPEASPFDGDDTFFSKSQAARQPEKHRRALSDSTVHESSGVKESDIGDLKIVISKPGEDHRPRTMEDLDPNIKALLDISIPSWRLGTPRFTVRGTPIIRGSSYAPTEEPQSNRVSILNRSQGDLNSSHMEMSSKRPSSLAVPAVRFSRPAPTSPKSPTSPRTIRPLHPSYISHSKIEPAMFDDLTFKPACDDRTIVRYSPATGAVTAATPPRLVAEITSPSFLDYELISDFFLTFRAFIESADLLRMLVSRLRWALERDDETGMVVRVRTFVALRHWILNYFMDDFVLDYNLRFIFCELLNDFVAELSQHTRSRKVQLKILGELKKCWRRVCALYWDGPDFDDSLDANVPVSPGGIAGHRDPSLDPSFWDSEDGEIPRLDPMFPPRKSTCQRTSFIAEISRAGHVGDSIVFENRPSTPEGQIIPDPATTEQNLASPRSMASVDIISCSFPNKSLRNYPLGTHPLGAHPVVASSVYNQSGPVATTPRALVGKRVRPAPPTHKRSNSLTDSLREHASDKASFKDKEFLLTLPFAGSLVRGNLLPPAQAFVDIGPDDASKSNRQTTTLHPERQDIAKERAQGGAMSGHGMKKLIGSVRRALSTRAQGGSHAQGSYINVAPIGPRGATTNRLPGTAIVPQDRHRQNGLKPPVRIDLLGAEAAEAFKEAVREEAATDSERHVSPMPSPNSSRSMPADIDYSAAHMDSTRFDTLADDEDARSQSDMAITAGSKSILIMDDTAPFDIVPVSHQETVSVNPSIDEFSDTFRLGSGDPTPPITPPAPSFGGTPRRSSHLLNQNVIRPSLSQDPLPHLVHASDTLVPRQSTRSPENPLRTSNSVSQRSVRHYPPLSYRTHRRNKSTKTQQSLNSVLHQRRYSFSSEVARSSLRSFDATTTYSEEESVSGVEPVVPVPQPLRVLRRRPGGDLRAATNVGELDMLSLRRSRSVGSLTAYSESLRGSYIQSPRLDSFGNGEIVSTVHPQQRNEVFSLGQLTEKRPPRDLSLFSTHSSKPVMRPSFEAEAQRLAQIPDDDEDDGGIESALLKLEGKYVERKQKQPDIIDLAELGVIVGESQIEAQERRDHHEHHEMYAMRQTFMLDPDSDEQEEHESVPDLQDGLLTPPRPTTGNRSFLSTSQESYSSIPILDRHCTDEGPSRPATGAWTNLSVLEGPDDELTPRQNKYGLNEEPDSSHQSFEVISKTESIKEIQPGSSAPSDEEESFLNDDSDLSSELSVDAVEDEVFGLEHVPPSRLHLPAHPLGSPAVASAPKKGPPSPPITFEQALGMSPPQSFEIPQIHENQVYNQKPLPPTPETTPTAPYLHSNSSVDDQTATTEALRMAPQPDPSESKKFNMHLPFILAFDSEILAQQFTLIEKDALNEIDWKELIEMNWKNATNNDSRSWVDFLRNSDAHGVEVVIARFNIMVKWAISEIVMTQHIEERARCIAKFIHIATHCRHYRNFATLGQLTIALSSNEVARLTKTWALVSPHDINTLRDLENLVTPMRNFYNLRAEMEVGSDSGCIPFVGIYTHDLLYNAQRPSEIAASPTTPPLINFERCRIAAAVVKTLLRLLEASTRYNFQPIEGITERCLWMSALSDEEIRRHSENLE